MGSFANVFGLYNPHPIDPVGALNQGMSLQNAIAMRKERQVQTDRLQLENQQLQRNMDAQKAIAGAISSATSQRPDGSYSTDWDAVDRSLTDQGWGREAISMRKERRDELTAGYKAMQEKMAANQKKLQITGQLFGAHPRVEWSLQQSDPVSFQTQMGQAQIGFKGLLAKGVELGLMNPQEAQTYAQLPYTPDLERYLDTLANAALTREQQIDKARNELNDQVRRHLETAQTERVNAELPGVQADAEHKVTTSAASTLANALSLGPAAYGQARAAIPSAAVQAKFPETPDWNNKDAAKKQIVAAGLTPNEISSDADRDRANEIRYDNLLVHQQMADLRQHLATVQEQNANMRAGLTPNGQGVQRRFDQRRDDSLAKQEGSLHRERWRIGDLMKLKNDSSYFDPITKKTETMDDDARTRLGHQLAALTDQVNDIRSERGLDPVSNQTPPTATPTPPSSPSPQVRPQMNAPAAPAPQTARRPTPVAKARDFIRQANGDRAKAIALAARENYDLTQITQ